MPTATMPTTADPAVETVTRAGVELVAVGTWDASTGRTRVTAADLQAMVDAQAESHYDIPPVKIGHDDDRFQDASGRPPSNRDGQPAYGWVENLRLNEEYVRPDGTKVRAGSVLVGDLVGIPRQLAQIMDTALRRRSVELVRNEPVGKRVFPAVLTALSLLGVQAPAVKGLSDLRAVYASQIQQAPERFSLLIEDDTPAVPQTATDSLDSDAETTHEGVTLMAKLNEGQRRALGIPDNATDEQVQARLRELGLKFSEDGDENGTQSVTPPAAATPPAPPAAEQPPVAQAPAAPVAPAGPAPQATASPSFTTQPPAAPAAPAAEITSAQVAASAAKFGLTVIDGAALHRLQVDAAAGAAARAEQDRQRRDGLVTAAVKAGKIAPEAFSAFRAQADTDESGVVNLFAAMPAVLAVADVEIGHAQPYTGLPATAPAEQFAVAKANTDRKRNAALAHFGVAPLPDQKGA